MIRFRNAFYLIILVLCCCKKLYNPPVISAAGSYLVIEGVINSGSDSTFIQLSRTVKLSSKVTANPELNAMVTVEGDQNVSYPLADMGNGTYACAGLNLDNSHKYRLGIKTTNGEQYYSDYIAVLNSPPIDSVTYDFKGALTVPGLNINVNTHDPTNQVRYFRWDYRETWEFHSAFQSGFISNGDTVLVRNQATDEIYTCWQSDTSSTILIGSSANLTKPVIANSPITSVISTAEKLGDKYSILVRQYALTPDAYNFYTQLKKNTEQIGSIFDAQPSENTGNIHCINNPSEPVIGYMSVGSVTSKRIFITNQQLPTWQTIPFYPDCALFYDYVDLLPVCCLYLNHLMDGAPVNQVDKFINYDKGAYDPVIPISPIVQPGGPIIGYTAAIPKCADCTLRGTNIEPSFWQ